MTVVKGSIKEGVMKLELKILDIIFAGMLFAGLLTWGLWDWPFSLITATCVSLPSVYFFRKVFPGGISIKK